MLESLTKKQKIIFFIILIIMILIIIYYVYSTLYTDDFSYNTQSLIQENNDYSSTDDSVLENSEDNTIVVYICGEVKESKVLTLKENSRICDAIDAVGGITENADITNINLAYILEDGEKIYIPKKGEETQTEDNSNSASQMHSYTSSKTTKININKATQTELETIPGIGPSSALKIINYREENGKFKSIEDIKNVSGIGDKKYESIKDYITVK